MPKTPRSPRSGPPALRPGPQASRGSAAERQLLVDISQLVLHDYKTGIQRVVRSVLSELLAHPPAGFRVEPVYARPGQPGFLYARTFLHGLGHGPDAPDGPITVWKGDVFLGLDLNHQAVLTQPAFYEALRRAGVKVCSVVYDLLPILLPKAFHGLDGSSHARWLAALARMDGLVCISRAVADEALAWLEAHGPRRDRPLPIGWFHLGADLEASLPSRGLPPEAGELLETLRDRPTFLMVATLEPRKGHRQVLEGFDRLWARGLDANLLFVGREGWSTEKLVHQLRHTHPERGRRLFWIEGASDEFLEQLYGASACLIAASEGEGFGLPLIEAAQHHIPILARDIPVFREVAGEHALYFSGPDPESLAERVAEWLALAEAGQAPGSEGLRGLTWSESTRDLMQVVLADRWYRTWTPSRPAAPGKDPSPRPPAGPAPRGPWERTIAVDARTLCLPGSTQRGIGHYTVHHLEALANLRPGWCFRLFLEAPDASDWGLDQLRALPNVELRPFGEFRAEGHDLVHVPDPMMLDPHPAWARLDTGTPATVVFYDLIPFLFREQFLDRWSPGAREDYARRIEALRRSPATVLTISEHTRRDLVTHLDFPAERLVPILAGLNQAPGPGPSGDLIGRVRTEWGLDGPFFLVVGALDHHKRFDISLQAFARVRQSHPIRLVVVGSLDHPTARAYREQFRNQGVDSILFTGFLPRAELECLYRAATGLLFPSIYEGFGFPVLEAMAQGCPVITTTAASLPEAAGEAALLTPPGDAEAVAKAMRSLLEDASLGRELQARGLEQARRFTWEAVARRTEEVWRSLWATATPGPLDEAAGERPLSVRWEGSQFVWHSLAHVNRQLCLGLLREGFDLGLVPYEPDQFRPADHPVFQPLATRLNRRPAGPVAVHVRHQWPPRFTPPPEGCWVMIQPWEYGGLPQSWIQPMGEAVDEVWVYTSWLRDRYLESGITADKVVVVPLGVDTARFRPEGPAFPLQTRKAFRFLFVGGIIPRKGLDVLLAAYRRAFGAADGVCLVVKAQGGGVYAGSELHAALKAHQRDPEAPALEVLQGDLSEADLAALYRSCHAFVLPYRGEGFGLPIAEAMASGLPVIVTGRGAAMDFTQGDWAYRLPSRSFPIPRVDALLPGPAGFWLEEPDEAALAECLAWVAAHPEEARAKGALARAHAEAHLGWEGPVRRVAERLQDLARRRPIRFRADAPPAPAPPATALVYEADWGQAEWAEVVLSHLTAFQPGEPVALVLPLPPAAPAQAAVEQRVVDLVRSTGRTAFPDILVLGPGEDLEEALRPYLIREAIPRGRGAHEGLRSLAGLRFAHARKQLTRT